MTIPSCLGCPSPATVDAGDDVHFCDACEAAVASHLEMLPSASDGAARVNPIEPLAFIFGIDPSRMSAITSRSFAVSEIVSAFSKHIPSISKS